MSSNDDLKIGALIGRGTYADVHLGIYRGSEVAIKICTIRVNQQYSTYQDKCNREASVLKALHHENVLRFIDVIEQTSTRRMCLILEYVQGGSMERFCKNPDLNLSDLDKHRIACSCWNGLAYLHDKKVCHKDIKPDNILISNDFKTVKIADFGLAEFKNLTSIYSTNTFEGTIMYLPPELASQGSEKPYRRHPQNSDVYSMGATLCVFFSGQPFWPVVYHEQEVMFKLITQWEAVQNKTEPLEPACWRGIKPEIQNLLKCAIDPDFSKRKSAHEMLDLFQKLDQTNMILVQLMKRAESLNFGSK